MDNVTVHFKYDTAHFSLNYPKALLDLPQNNLKKLFKFMVSDWHLDGNTAANAEAVRITHEQLTAYVEETQQAWAEASKIFQNCYVDTKYRYGGEKKAAEANNKRLLAAVKTAKSKNTRAKNLLSFFEEVKAKYLS